MAVPPRKQVHIISGGTVFHVRPHVALFPPSEAGLVPDLGSAAYGAVGRRLLELCEQQLSEMDVVLHLTRMANAGQGDLETNEDVAGLLDTLVADPLTKIIFMSAAMTDYEGEIIAPGESG